MNDIFQQIFSFDEKRGKKSLPGAVRDSIGNSGIRRAVIGWMLSENPSGVGVFVPTRLTRFQADVAGFWSEPVKRNGKKILYPVKTVVIETKVSRGQCWPDCAKKDTLLPMLKEEKGKKKKLEKLIRQDEPDLNLNDNLFPDIEAWNYSLSKNKEYHQCCRAIEEIEAALYDGSHFEKIRKALIADFLYLAVPAGMVSEHEIADGWGLLYVNKDMSVNVIKTADDWECPMENKLHLVQNISSSNMKSFLFAAGINLDKNGKAKFVKLPKRRRGQV